MFHLASEVGKIGDVLAEKKVTLPWLVDFENMVKAEKFDILHLVYHLTAPLNLPGEPKFGFDHL